MNDAKKSQHGGKRPGTGRPHSAITLRNGNRFLFTVPETDLREEVEVQIERDGSRIFLVGTHATVVLKVLPLSKAKDKF